MLLTLLTILLISLSQATPTDRHGVAFACANPDPSSPPGILLYPSKTVIPYPAAASLLAGYVDRPQNYAALLGLGTGALGFALGVACARWKEDLKKLTWSSK